MAADVTTPDGATLDPRVRTAWMVVGGIAVVVMLGIGTTSAVGVVAREQRVVHQEFDAADLEVVDVSSDNGNVRVYGDAESSVRVTIEVSEGLTGIDRVARVDGTRLVLSSSCPGFLAEFCEADYEVHVPPGVRVVAHSDNGDASVTGVDGGAEIVSSNGDVLGDRLGGDIRLTTSNGGVQATALDGRTVVATSDNGDVAVDFGSAPTDVTATSDNGDVEIRVPRSDAMYAVDATTDNGDATTPIRTDPASDRRLVARSDNGDVAIRYR